VNYRVFVSHEAEKVLDRLDRTSERRFRARFVQLAGNPSIHGSLLR
jgi:mRNA-degrading endonuclease RelE of RelBE toxin-antitoxin system